MADPAAEARIRDLERRLDLDPGSRLFVSLADEYRRLGRVKDALSSLQKGLLAHPGYVAAQVALGRVYLEASQPTDAIATFTKVLVADPANLVAAKSLAEIHLGRNDNLEALKKYKLYRAISGDRKVDEVIARLEPLVAPKPVAPPRKTAETPPPPPKFQETDKGRRRAPALAKTGPAEAPPLSDAFELTSVAFEVGEDSGSAKAEDPFPFVPTRDQALEPASRSGPAAAPVPAAAVPPTEQPPAPAPVPPAVSEGEPSAAAEPARPSGRALADLYYAQGHFAEALQIYDDLVLRHPFDEDLKRMRRDAEARLLPASTAPAAAAPDVSLERRLSRIRALKQWLGLVQAG